MRYASLFILIIGCLMYTMDASAKDNAAASKTAGTPRDCLQLLSIRNMTAIDNKTLLFEMPNHKYYVNRLRHVCYGLDSGNPIMYRTSMDSLCNLDLITVLDPVGSGFQRGSTCGLSQFVPVSREQAKAMLKKRKR